MAYLGLDVGSISVKVARVSAAGELLAHRYQRHYGKPLEVAQQVLEAELAQHPEVENVGFTGSSGARLAELLGAPFENEIVAHGACGGAAHAASAHAHRGGRGRFAPHHAGGARRRRRGAHPRFCHEQPVRRRLRLISGSAGHAAWG